jgi:pimeloyl-ACP methyl ester carboxylesterase
VRSPSTDQSLFEAKIADFFNRSKNLPSTTVITSTMTDAVSAALNSGNKAIVIAHSQGNMFANAILSAITATQSPNIVAGLKVVAIATPAAIAQNNRYKTAHQDQIINILSAGQAVSANNLLPLSSNIDVPGALVYDNTGHGLLEVYLNPALAAMDNVVNMISDAIQLAINPRCPQIANVCPDTFTQTQLNQIMPNMTVNQVNGIFGCAGFNAGVSNWYFWYNNQSLTSFTLNTASVYFTNGIYLSG